MDRLQNPSDYHDFSGLNSLRSDAKSEDGGKNREALHAAAKQFESIFMKMLLSSMRKAGDVLESDSPFNSQTTKFYRDMHDQQLAVNLSEQGSLGLADMIVKQLSNDYPGYKPASVLRGDANPLTIKSSAGSEKKSDAVPVESASKSKEQDPGFFENPVAFVQSMLPVAKKVASAVGMNPVMMVAQAALETGWGSKIIKKTNGDSSFNLFGIKADTRWSGDKAQVQTLEYRDGVARKESASFRAYGSIEDSMKDYLSFLSSNPRYDKALQNVQQPDSYFNELQQAGYATDPQYAKKVMNVMKQISTMSGTNLANEI